MLSNSGFVENFKPVEVVSKYIPHKGNFFFNEDTYNACITKNQAVIPYGNATKDHIMEWLDYYPDNNRVLVLGAANLFSKTDPETFEGWMAIRSDITTEDELAEDNLKAEPDRNALFPLLYPKTYGFRKTIEKLNWTTEEVAKDLGTDHKDLSKISADELTLLENTLSFFSVADELINEGIDDAVRGRLVKKEDIHYLDSQMNQEDVHSEAYSMQVQEIVAVDRQEEIRNRVKTSKTVGAMADWVRWWIVGDHPTADLMVAMAFMEGVLFSGFFAILQFFKSRNLFAGVTRLNEYICRDEHLHTMFWMHKHNDCIQKKTSTFVGKAIARATVELSEKFFKGAIPRDITGINAQLLNQHVRSICDDVMTHLNFPTIYDITSPLTYMDALKLNDVAKSNFFERDPTQYSQLEKGALEFVLDRSDPFSSVAVTE